MTPTELIDLLARHQTLGSAPRAELEWLAAHGTLRSLTSGDILSHQGEPVEGMFIVLSGHIAIYVDRGAGLKKVTEWRTGDVTGLLPYSRLTAPPGDSVAQEPTTLLEIHRDQFRDMIGECHEVTAILVHTMVDRARLFASSALHDQKMISLGNLSARLAHELNNPATAIERAAATLEDRIDDAESAALALGAARPDERQLAAVRALRDACLAKKIQGILSPIQQAEREERIADWLEDHGIDSAIAGALGETTITIEALDDVAVALDGACLDAVLRWAAAGCSVRVLASEIQDAASRISGLVAGVKGFTHMDQGGPAAPVDLITNLTNTIVVFRSKAREKSVAIALNVEPDLPQAIGFAGEINQIFANLLDNALDAVRANGHIEVRAGRERGRVIVSVIDDGPGIPPEIRERIFEPLFTTKPVNKGTGLGLDIVRRLVNQNNAHIEVESVPGRTEFKVSLPAVDSQVKGAPA